MNFLEKNLEDIIWGSYEACAERGLDLNTYDVSEPQDILRLRQLALHPYGIADLVNIYYNPSSHCLSIQIIECKKGVINLDTYKQAKRYETAFRHFLAESIEASTARGGSVVFNTVLVGASFDARDDFSFLYNSDQHCDAFTYSYEVDGIFFDRISKNWQRQAGNHSCIHDVRAQVKGLVKSSIEHDIAQFEDHIAFKASWAQKHGDTYSPLLITPGGVLLNTRLITGEITFSGQQY